ncbi:MAG TPA: ATP-binding protein [Chitinophagaceae bacterium]|nr:ATP-binding protein [Chitinophagaceae bacterium]
MQRFLIFQYLLLILVGPVVAQTVGNSHLRQYTTDNGLPSNGIKGLQWDEQTGFLWIATEAGIVRFNGVDFRSYTKENTPSISSERMLFMVRNITGNIYISDMPGNIFSIEQNKPVLWKKGTASVNPYYANYFLLAVSDTFFQQHNNIVNTRFSAVTDKIIALGDTSCLVLSMGILFYHSLSLKFPVPLPFEKNSFKSIFKIEGQCFLVNKKNEAFLLNTTNFSMSPVPVIKDRGSSEIFTPGNNPIFWEPGMNDPVLIEKEKAWLFTYKDNKIIATLAFTGIPSDALIRTIQYSKKNKTLFIGTDSKGLIVLNQTAVTTKKRTSADSKNRNSYYSQIELPNGNVLTNEGDIIGDQSPLTTPLPVKGKFSYYVSGTGDSLIWYSQFNPSVGGLCIHQYNKISGQTKVFGKLRSDYVVAASGSQYYLANSVGVGILENDTIRVLHKYSGKNIGNITFDIKEIEPGVLVIATCNGLFRFHTSTSRLDTLFSKENICVRSIWKYKDYVFFGTYGSGFYIYRNGQIKSMPLDKNKYLLYAHCFVPDDNGYCWISTNHGLFKSSLAELINVFENKATYTYYHYFGKKDGMEMTELNGGCTPCALRLKNNTISFPSMDGLLWVKPEEALPVLPEGNIFIDEVLIDDEIKDPESLSQKSLPFKTGEIIIRLAFSAWCNKENIYLEYQLNDTVNWKPINSGTESEIRFNNLPSGRYTLRIRKLNGFGFSNYTYKTINFSITTPWHQQWWFFVLSSLIVLGLLSLYFRFRTRQYEIRQRKLEKQVAEKTRELQQQNEILEKNNTIKTRLISIISHDIVTPLKFLTVAGKNLLQKRKLMPEELQQETIQEMTNTSQELQLLSTNILNWIKYQNENRRMAKETFNLHEMVGQVLGILQSLARQKNILIENRVDANMEVYQYYEPLKILIYNLLTNAIHFTEKGNIIVSAVREEEQVIVSVKDEGAGMTPEQIQRLMADDVVITSANIDNKKGHGLGYLIIKDLLKTMGATLHIESKKAEGTTVSISIAE